MAEASYQDDWTEDRRTWQEWWDSLTDKEREAEKVRLAQAPRVAPQEGPQTAAFLSEADVVGYGGAAGGGKSALICLLCLLEHQRSVVFRYDKSQLGALVDDLVHFAGTDAGLNRQWGIFRLGDGRVIEFGGIGAPGEELKWQGRPHDLLAIDEATQVQRRKFEWLKTWNRTTKRGQRTRILLTFNPPGSPGDESGDGGRWVIDYFAPWLDERHPNPAEPGEIRYFVRNEEGDEVEVSDRTPYTYTLGGKEITVLPEGRTFIPAQVFDNAFLMHDQQYLSRLSSLEEPYRSMMMLGDFRRGIVDASNQVIPAAWVDEAMERHKRVIGNGDAYDPGFMSALGIDVARGGRDETVFAPRHGFVWPEITRKPGVETKTGREVGQPALDMVENGAAIAIDSNGVGASPYDWLDERWPNVLAVVAQGKPLDLQAYEKGHKLLNLRAALWRLMRKVLDPDNQLKPMLPPDKRLRSELIAPRQKIRGGILRIEDKDDIIQRLGYSTDGADAVIQTLRNVRSTVNSEKLMPGKGFKRMKSKASKPTGSNRSKSWMAS